MGWDVFLHYSNKESLLRLKVRAILPLTISGYLSAAVTEATAGSVLLAGL